MKKVLFLQFWLLGCSVPACAGFDQDSLHDGLIIAACITSGFAAVFSTWAIRELLKMEPRVFRRMKDDIATHRTKLEEVVIAIDGIKERLNALEMVTPPPYVRVYEQPQFAAVPGVNHYERIFGESSDTSSDGVQRGEAEARGLQVTGR